MPLTVYPAPVTATLEMVTLELPLFVMVVVKELLFPTCTFPKLRLAGDAPRVCVAAVPVPERLIAS